MERDVREKRAETTVQDRQKVVQDEQNCKQNFTRRFAGFG